MLAQAREQKANLANDDPAKVEGWKSGAIA